MNFNGNSGFDYNRNRNRNRQRNRNNGGYNDRRYLTGSMLPRWYRDAYFGDCAGALGSNSFSNGDEPAFRVIDESEQRPQWKSTRQSQSKPRKEGTTQRRFEAPDANPAAQPQPVKQVKEDKHQAEREVLSKFIADYGSHISDISYLRGLMIDTFTDVLAILRKYGDDRYVDLFDQMDKVFTLMCTSQLSSLILSILEENGFPDWDNSWKDLAVAISIVMSNYGNRINNTGAKVTYVNDIIPCGSMWKREITTLVDDYRITKEMAMDLVMKIPVLAEDMRTWDLNQYYIGFEWCMITHAHDNMEVLDADLQGQLFDFFFGGENNIAVKAISRFLASPPVVIGEDDEVTTAIGNAFREMLYKKLDKYDIEEIERTLKYIIKERKQYQAEGKSIDIVLYTAVEAMQFENIAKAINNIVDADDSAKQYLA